MSQLQARSTRENLRREAPNVEKNLSTEPQSRDLLRVLVLVAALGLAALGFLVGATSLLLSLFSDEGDSLSLVILSFSILALAVGLGLAVAWHAWRAIQGYQSLAFRPKRIGLLVGIFLLSAVLGHTILALDILPLIAFPIFHVLAIVLPALIILALVGHGLGEITTRRDVVLQIAGGAFLGAPLAFALEVFVLLSLLGAAFLGLVARPGGQELIKTMATYLQDPTWLEAPGFLAPAFHSPTIIAVAFVFVVGMVPLIEEGVKTLGIGLMAHRKPSLDQAFLWGLAGGAGFAIIEGLLNSTGGLVTWAPLVLLRGGTTLLHCFTGALMGIAWYKVLTKKQWGHAFGLYAASVGIHGLWNALSIGMVFLAQGSQDAGSTGTGQLVSGLGMVTMLVLLGTLTLILALSLLGLTLHIRKHTPASQHTSGHPPAVAPQAVIVEGQLGSE